MSEPASEPEPEVAQPAQEPKDSDSALNKLAYSGAATNTGRKTTITAASMDKRTRATVTPLGLLVSFISS